MNIKKLWIAFVIIAIAASYFNASAWAVEPTKDQWHSMAKKTSIVNKLNSKKSPINLDFLPGVTFYKTDWEQVNDEDYTGYLTIKWVDFNMDFTRFVTQPKYDNFTEAQMSELFDEIDADFLLRFRKEMCNPENFTVYASMKALMKVFEYQGIGIELLDKTGKSFSMRIIDIDVCEIK